MESLKNTHASEPQELPSLLPITTDLSFATTTILRIFAIHSWKLKMRRIPRSMKNVNINYL